jgi:dienelactone hydrolase
MKNIKYLLIGLFICSNVTTAQLKAVTYKDGEQVLNGFELLLQKEYAKPGILILPAWRGIDKASKDIATDLSKLGYFSLLQIFTAKELSKDNAEAGKSAGYYKTNYKAYKKELH